MTYKHAFSKTSKFNEYLIKSLQPASAGLHPQAPTGLLPGPLEDFKTPSLWSSKNS